MPPLRLRSFAYGLFCLAMLACGSDDTAAPTKPPKILAVNPVRVTGGDVVTIMGTDFGAKQGTKSSLSLGDVAVEPSAWSANGITFTVPPNAKPGSIDLVLTVVGRQAQPTPIAVYPSIKTIAPDKAAAGDSVTVTGTNLGDSEGNATLDGDRIDTDTWGPESFTFTVNDGMDAGLRFLGIEAGGELGLSTLEFTIAPRIASLSPVIATGGDVITIDGSLGASGQIEFAGYVEFPVSWSSRQATFIVPFDQAAGTYSVNVLSGSERSNTVALSVRPRIDFLDYTTAEWADVITLYGGNWGSLPKVQVGGVDANLVSFDDMGISFSVPPNAPPGAQDVVVIGEGIASVGQTLTITPYLQSISPSQASAGANITLTGANFGSSPAAGTVYIGGTSAEIVSWAPTQIVARVSPTAPPGAQTAYVRVGGADTAALAMAITPAVTGVAPAAAGYGATVTVTGTNFGTSGSLRVGGVQVSTSQWQATSVRFVMSATLTPGSTNLDIVSGGRTSNTIPFAVKPVVTTLSKAAVVAGDTVTISGGNFGATSSQVRIGGIAATVNSWSNTSISITVPNTAPHGLQDVVVTAGFQSSNALKLTVTPALGAVVNGGGQAGSTVTVTGANLGAAQGASTLTLGGTVITPAAWSATQIQFVVPPELAGGKHTLVLTVGEAVLSADVTIVGTLTGLSASAAQGGATVVISGHHFGTSETGRSVSVGGVTAQIVSWSDTSISFIVPTDIAAGVHGVSVVTNGAPSPALNLTITPVIEALSQTSGAAGVALTLTGRHFGAAKGASAVTVGGQTATVAVWGMTSIALTIPATLPVGTHIVAATVAGQTSNAVTYTVVPSITGAAATGTGGNSVVISGTSFGALQGSSTVRFGATPAAVSAWSNTSITAIVPTTAPAGGANLSVTVAGVVSNERPFTITPNHAAMSPSSGPIGTPVTLTGSNFGDTQGASTLVFGGTAVAPSAWSNTSISFVVPSVARASFSVYVDIGGVVSQTRSFVVSPGITGVTPAVGSGGTTITIAGTNFGATQGFNTVTIGGVTATVSNWTNTAITAVIPTTTTAGSANVVVTVGGVAGNAAPITVQPAITGAVQNAASATLTVAGRNFGASMGASSITVGGLTPTVTSWTQTSITVTLPSALEPGTRQVAVEVNGQPAVADAAIYPYLQSRSPASVQVNGAVTLSGSLFGPSQGASTVTVGGVAAQVTSWGNTSISLTVPAQPAGTNDIVVTVNGMTGNVLTLTVTPGIDALSPAQGVVTDLVTITGSNFGGAQGASTVAFGAAIATVTSWTDTQITAIVPPQTAGSYAVGVNVNGALSNTRTFALQPTITGLTPSNVAVGATVTLSGAGFGATKGTSSVTVDGVAATTGTWNNTTISFTVPAGITAGARTVTVTVGGQAASYAIAVRPNISSISPTGGPAGTNVTLAGSNFGAVQLGSRIAVDGFDAPVLSWTNTSIQAKVPDAVTAGTRYWAVTVDGVASNTQSFAIVPAVTAVAPSTVSTGTNVVITGKGFGASQGSSSVNVSGVAATVVSWAPESIVFLLPSGVGYGTRSLTVTVGGQSNAVVYLAVVPRITSVGPSSVAVGSTFWVLGSNFGSSQGASTVTVGGVTPSVSNWSQTGFLVTMPNVFTPGSVEVAVTIGGTVMTTSIEVAPSITARSPTSGVAGTAVRIDGTNFGAAQGASALTFGGVAAEITSWSNATIFAKVPTDVTAGSAAIGLTVNGVASASASFTVTPSLVSVSPATVTGGTVITVSGYNLGGLQGASNVFVGSVAAQVVGWTMNSIQAVVPSTVTPGSVGVSVSVGGSSSSALAVTLNPAVTSLSVATGTGGTEVVIAGNNFGTTTGSVQCGGASLGVIGWAMRSITVVVPNSLTVGTCPLLVTANSRVSNALDFAVYARITGLTPAAGPVGTAISLTGSNFGGTKGASNLYVDGAVAGTTSWSHTAISGTVPAGLTRGNKTVTVNVNAVTTVTTSFTVTPGITGISPTSGSGGTLLSISGSNFGDTQGSSTLEAGGAPLAVLGWSDTALVANLPDSVTGGSHVVRVTVDGLPSNTATLTVKPALTSLSQAGGVAGDQVTLTGTNFGTVQGTNTVTFGGSQGTIVSWSASSVVAQVPGTAAGGTVNVQIQVGGQTSNTLSYTIKPQITSALPVTVTTGNTIAVGGVNFGPSQGASSVRLGGVTLSIASWSNTLIMANMSSSVPGGTQPLVVLTGGEPSDPVSLYVKPTLTSFSPVAAAGGASVTLTGANFGPSQNTSLLTVGGVSLTANSWSHTSIVFSVPPSLDAGAYTTLVQVGGQTSNSLSFVVPPGITGLSRAFGSAGTEVTITGTGFGASQGASSVSFGGVAAAVLSWSASQVVAVVPAGADPGAANVTVTVAGLTSAPALFGVVPVLTALSPGTGVSGATVTLTGTHFGASQGTGRVLFGQARATVTAWSAGSITVVAPTQAAAAELEVTVHTKGVSSNRLAFVYQLPRIEQRYPALASNGTSVSVVGAGFGASPGTLYLDGVATAVDGWSDGTVQFTVTAATAKGRRAIRIATSGGVLSNAAPVVVRGSDVWYVHDAPHGRFGHSVVWTGNEMIVWGGAIGSPVGMVNGGARYSPATDSWMHLPTANAPSARQNHTAVWTGNEMVVWGGSEGGALSTGGRYDPSTDTWTPLDVTGAPTSRESHTAVWTGDEMIIWGGNVCPSSCSFFPSDGSRYRPATNTWTTIAASGITARARHTTVWTGEEMIVWGGTASSTGSNSLASGARYKPADNTWTAVQTAGAPDSRYWHTAVWTGTEMLVFGGRNYDTSSNRNDGGRYSPATNKWTPTTVVGAPTPRYRHAAAWTGAELLVWGGYGAAYLDSGGRYDPASDTWLPMSTAGAPQARWGVDGVWSGTELLVWGGSGSATLHTGGRYRPADDTWSPIATDNRPAATDNAATAWTGSQFFVWGGYKNGYSNEGSRYLPATDTWLPTSSTGAPEGRHQAKAAWADGVVVVWGGTNGIYLNSGGRYDPAADAWSAMAAAFSSGRRGHSMSYTGNRVVVWGGHNGSTYQSAGGRYDPVTNTWANVSSVGAPAATVDHSAVVTATAVIIWGGSNGSSYGGGGRYDAVADAWLPISATGAPSARFAHTAVWTGSEMIVWGGYDTWYSGTGARFNPASNTWSALPVVGAPAPRYAHVAAWTGSAMLVWGGRDGNFLINGSRYDPATNTWSTMSSANAMTQTYGAHAAFTGQALLVLGNRPGGDFGVYFP